MAGCEGYGKRLKQRECPVGYLWAAFGVGAATGCFWLARALLDKGQASLLYLPVVIACAIRFGFGPAVAGALLSFLCWDFFFLPPFGTFAITNPKDWISLFVFLVAAVTTAQLAARAREQTRLALAREAEIATLFQASEIISREVHADRLLAALAQQLQALCHASRCRVFRHDPQDGLHLISPQSLATVPPNGEAEAIHRMAEAAYEHRQSIGFGMSQNLWAKALDATRPVTPEAVPPSVGAYVPLQAENRLVGVLHVGPRSDGIPFSATDERLILTLANHAAVVIARQSLAEEAAQATALREADALKDALLSMVTHELRTPLAAIKAAASGLRQRESVWSEDARVQAVAAIDGEADRLTTLVSNLLDLSRLEAGAWNPSKEWCDLNEVVGTVLDRLPAADAARVQERASDDLPLIRADYVQIALVLTNLLQNAAKYTPPECPILLSLSSAGTDPPGIRVDVRDFGEGIAPGDEDAIFARFYRSARHSGSTVHGTGLGLALCRAIVQAHGGRIWAGNAPSDTPPGAILSFFLPVE